MRVVIQRVKSSKVEVKNKIIGQIDHGILVLIGIISGLARHYFNLRGRNIHKISFLYISIIALIILAGIIFIFKT